MKLNLGSNNNSLASIARISLLLVILFTAGCSTRDEAIRNNLAEQRQASTAAKAWLSQHGPVADDLQASLDTLDKLGIDVVIDNASPDNRYAEMYISSTAYLLPSYFHEERLRNLIKEDVSEPTPTRLTIFIADTSPNPGLAGKFDRDTNTITLYSSVIRSNVETTLLHELAHLLLSRPSFVTECQIYFEELRQLNLSERTETGEIPDFFPKSSLLSQSALDGPPHEACDLIPFALTLRFDGDTIVTLSEQDISYFPWGYPDGIKSLSFTQKPAPRLLKKLNMTNELLKKTGILNPNFPRDTYTSPVRG